MCAHALPRCDGNRSTEDSLRLIAQRRGRRPLRLAVFVHVSVVGNWEDVLADILQTIAHCGLARVASVHFAVDGVPEDALCVRAAADKIALELGASNPYGATAKGGRRGPSAGIGIEAAQKLGRGGEMTTLGVLRGYCRREVDAQSWRGPPAYRGSDEAPLYVAYVHTKGVTRSGKKGYCRVCQWRRYLQHYVLERPALCVEMLHLRGATVCGVDWRTWPAGHFFGNFWWASCEYINKLNTPCPDPPKVRHKAWTYICTELWVGNYTRRKFPYTNSPDMKKWLYRNYTKENSVAELAHSGTDWYERTTQPEYWPQPRPVNSLGLPIRTLPRLHSVMW